MSSFKIDEYEFRFAKMKPTKMLALVSLLGSKDAQEVEETYDTILEHVEINIEGSFRKLIDRGIYFPTTIEERLDILQELVVRFIKDCLTPVFKKSTESTK